MLIITELLVAHDHLSASGLQQAKLMIKAPLWNTVILLYERVDLGVFRRPRAFL